MKILNLFAFLLIGSTIQVSLAQSNYVAHEWGTFTSVINKDGQQLQGLHHEEEALPRFVYDLSKRDGTTFPNPLPGGPITKGFIPQAMNLMPIPTFTGVLI
jgi:hypothetical protein